MFTHRWPVLGAVLSLVLSATALAADLSTSPADAERVARAAYQLLQERATASGYDLQLDLSELEHLSGKALSEAHWVDLVTMPGGPMIGLHRSTIAKSFEGSEPDRRVEYHMSWSEGEEYAQTPEGRILSRLTAAQVLERLAATEPAYRDVEAITSFSVHARMDERSRAYKAALLWTSSRSAPGTAGLMVVDHITQGVADAATEQLEAASAAWKARSPAPLWGGEGEPAPTSCLPFQVCEPGT